MVLLPRCCYQSHMVTRAARVIILVISQYGIVGYCTHVVCFHVVCLYYDECSLMLRYATYTIIDTPLIPLRHTAMRVNTRYYETTPLLYAIRYARFTEKRSHIRAATSLVRCPCCRVGLARYAIVNVIWRCSESGMVLRLRRNGDC